MAQWSAHLSYMEETRVRFTVGLPLGAKPRPKLEGDHVLYVHRAGRPPVSAVFVQWSRTRGSHLRNAGSNPADSTKVNGVTV